MWARRRLARGSADGPLTGEQKGRWQVAHGAIAALEKCARRRETTFFALATAVGAGPTALTLSAVLSGIFCGVVLFIWAARKIVAHSSRDTLVEISAKRRLHNAEARARAGAALDMKRGSAARSSSMRR